MTDPTSIPLARLRENLIDVTAAIEDAVATFDPSDPIAVAHLAALSDEYRRTIASLAFVELHAVIPPAVEARARG